MDTTTIDIAVGLVGTEEEWAPSIREFSDVTQGSYSGSSLDSTALEEYSSGADSISSAMITMTVRGDGHILDDAGGGSFYIEMEVSCFPKIISKTRPYVKKNLVHLRSFYRTL